MFDELETTKPGGYDSWGNEVKDLSQRERGSGVQERLNSQ